MSDINVFSHESVAPILEPVSGEALSDALDKIYESSTPIGSRPSTPVSTHSADQAEVSKVEETKASQPEEDKTLEKLHLRIKELEAVTRQSRSARLTSKQMDEIVSRVVDQVMPVLSANLSHQGDMMRSAVEGIASEVASLREEILSRKERKKEGPKTREAQQMKQWIEQLPPLPEKDDVHREERSTAGTSSSDEEDEYNVLELSDEDMRVIPTRSEDTREVPIIVRKGSAAMRQTESVAAQGFKDLLSISEDREDI